MVAVDNKPLNALHDLKQRGKMPVNVFELTRKLYYEKLKALIDKDLKKLKGKNDEEYKKLELINLVCYDDKTEKGVFTKPILEKIDDGGMKWGCKSGPKQYINMTWATLDNKKIQKKIFQSI